MTVDLTCAAVRFGHTNVVLFYVDNADAPSRNGVRGSSG